MYGLLIHCLRHGADFALFVSVNLLVLTIAASSECSSRPVQLIATSRKQILTSPGYPVQYGRALLCRWLIRAEGDGQVIRLNVKDTQLEPSTGCRSDYVQIHDGPHRIYKPLYRWCGTRRPPLLLPTTHDVLAVFKTNLRDCRRGFALEYWCERKDAVKLMSPGVRRDLFLVLVGLISFTFLTATLFLMTDRIKGFAAFCRDNIYLPGLERVHSQPGAKNSEDKSRRQLACPKRHRADFHAVVKMVETTLIGDTHLIEQPNSTRGVEESNGPEDPKTDEKRLVYEFHPRKKGERSQDEGGEAPIVVDKQKSRSARVSQDTEAGEGKNERRILTTRTEITSADLLGTPQPRIFTLSGVSPSLTQEMKGSAVPHKYALPELHVPSVVKTTVFSAKARDLHRIKKLNS